MELTFSRDTALDLLRKYNKEPFHIRHALTMETVMRRFAIKKGYADDSAFWAMSGLLHDIDYGTYPDQHCQMAPALLAEIAAPEALVHAICSHGYGICADVAPIHEMEKIQFAVDELTGLIGASILMRPSKSCKDMELKSLKKKFKDKHFAAGVSRDIIRTGAERLGVPLEDLLAETLLIMQEAEDELEASCALFGC